MPAPIVTIELDLRAEFVLSTAEAEYLSSAQEAVWLRTMLKELHNEQAEPTVIFEDNQGCIAMTIKPGQHQRTKHIDIRHHFIKDLVDSNQVLLKYLPTEEELRAELACERDAAERALRLAAGVKGPAMAKAESETAR